MVACSSDDANGTDADEDTDGGEDADTASEGEESDGDISGDLEVQYFVGGYGDSWWKEVIADFQEEYPDVNVIEHAGPNINDEMRSRWVSNDPPDVDRKSTRLNSSHVAISYAVFCLKKKI